MKEKIAVVIPCYNYGRFIEETVESVMRSTYSNYEIIVVDDGSTDLLTLKVLNGLPVGNRLKVIRRENGGLSAARNTGIHATNAKYILTLDADDLIAPTFIERGIELLHKHPEASFVYPLVQLFGNRQEIWETLPYDYHYLKFRNYIPATIIMKREVWERVGGYDETMRDGFEDWEFVLRAGARGYYGLHINEILFFYRKHSGSMLEGSKKKNRMLKALIRKKHKEMYKFFLFQWGAFVIKELYRRVMKHFRKSEFNLPRPEEKRQYR